MLAILAGWRGYVLAAVFAGLAAAGSAWEVQDLRYNAQLATIARDRAQQLADATQLARQAEQARSVAQTENLNAAQERETTALADAAAADAAADRLRKELADLQRHARSAAPAQSGASEQDTDTIGLLAELYGRMEADGRTVVKFADALKNAGLTCEGLYDSLTTP